MATIGNPATGSGGGVATQNKQYTAAVDNYTLQRHAVEGQSRIREEGTTYLMKPPALVDPGNDPLSAKYNFYKSFAEFPELVSLALMGIQGLIHQASPLIELPSQLNYLLERATPDGKSLEDLWVDMTREIFLMGRGGLLPEVYDNSVYLCQYNAESIINWHKIKSGSGNMASLVTLHEPVDEPVGEGFAVNEVDYYRVLRLDDDGQYVEELYKSEVKILSTGDKSLESELVDQYPISPSRMGVNWDFIPFVPLNAINTEFDIGQIPLGPVAQKALDIYRKSATYHRTLYLKGDPPLIRTGFSKEEAEEANTVGGGVLWDAANPQATAGYVEPTGDSIPHQRTAILDDFAQAEQAIGRLIDDNKQGIESEGALRERRAAKSVTLVGVLNAAAEGFERALRNCTVVMGGNPDDVVFKPNLDFMAAELTADDVLKYAQGKNSGAPLSNRSIHEIFRKGGVTEMAFDDEMEEIADEDPTGLLTNRQEMPGDEDEGDEDESGDDKGDGGEPALAGGEDE